MSDADDAFFLIRNVYRDHKTKAEATGCPQVFFEQLPGGRVSDPRRIEVVLTALVRLQNSGELDASKVMTCIGPVTYATTPQIAWFGSLGVYTLTQFNEGNLVEMARTIPSLIYYQCGIVPTSGGAWDLKEQYRRVRQEIEDVIATMRAVHIHTTHAAGRGEPVPGDPLVRALLIHHLTSAERKRFLHGYEKVHADADHFTRAIERSG